MPNREDLEIADLSKLTRFDAVYLQAGENDQILEGKFLAAGEESNIVSIALKGSSTGLPFNLEEWSILVSRQVQIPNADDIDQIIVNGLTRGRAGFPVSSTELAAEIMQLIRGEIETPIKPYEIPQPSEEIADMAGAMPDGAPAPSN